MQEGVLLGLQVVAGGEKRLQHMIDFLGKIDVYSIGRSRPASYWASVR